MFGRNVLMKVDHGDGLKLEVQELFPTIQGEGPFAGTPAFFLRLAGCNLRCTFCDTDFESQARPMHIHDITRQFMAWQDEEATRGTSLVVITGGEPMRQNLVPIVASLVSAGFRVQIETAGTVWCDGLQAIGDAGVLTIVCSPKTATVHPMIERLCRDWKYIVRMSDGLDPDDGLPIAATQLEQSKPQRIARPPQLWRALRMTVWLQPCEEYVNSTPVHFSVPSRPVRDVIATRENEQLCVRLAQRHGYRLSLQLHKALGLP